MATKAATRAIQTPGETVKPEETKGDAFTANVVASGADEPLDEMAQMRAQMAAMMEQNAALQAAVTNLARGVQAAKPVTQDLPNMADLDLSIITSPVLTKDGWFVPPSYGSNPAIQKQ
jgi:hypothetical protein